MTKKEILEKLFEKKLNSKLFAIIDCGHYIEMVAKNEFPYEEYGIRIKWIGDATDLIRKVNRTIFWYEEVPVKNLVERMLSCY